MSDTKTILISGTENAISHIKQYLTLLENSPVWMQDETDAFSALPITDDQLEVITRALVKMTRDQKIREIAEQFESTYKYGGTSV